MGPLIHGRRESGAALVEFAVLLPLLLAVVMGIVEFGYTISQQLEVRHAAREAARMVAVDEFTLTDACDRMQLATGASVTISGSGTVGEEATITVDAPLTTITGFFDVFLPVSLDATAKVRVEQDQSLPGGGPCP